MQLTRLYKRTSAPSAVRPISFLTSLRHDFFFAESMKKARPQARWEQLPGTLLWEISSFLCATSALALEQVCSSFHKETQDEQADAVLWQQRIRALMKSYNECEFHKVIAVHDACNLSLWHAASYRQIYKFLHLYGVLLLHCGQTCTLTSLFFFSNLANVLLTLPCRQTSACFLHSCRLGFGNLALRSCGPGWISAGVANHPKLQI